MGRGEAGENSGQRTAWEVGRGGEVVPLPASRAAQTCVAEPTLLGRAGSASCPCPPPPAPSAPAVWDLSAGQGQGGWGGGAGPSRLEEPVYLLPGAGRVPRACGLDCIKPVLWGGGGGARALILQWQGQGDTPRSSCSEPSAGPARPQKGGGKPGLEPASPESWFGPCSAVTQLVTISKQGSVLATPPTPRSSRGQISRRRVGFSALWEAAGGFKGPV